MNDEVRALVMQNADAATIRRHCTSTGMKQLRQDGADRVLAGETTVALTANAVSHGDRRQATAKGLHGDTIAGFPVQTLTPRSARRTIPFVGRPIELATLRDELAAANVGLWRAVVVGARNGAYLLAFNSLGGHALAGGPGPPARGGGPPPPACWCMPAS